MGDCFVPRSDGSRFFGSSVVSLSAPPVLKFKTVVLKVKTTVLKIAPPVLKNEFVIARQEAIANKTRVQRLIGDWFVPRSDGSRFFGES
jgi:hypothetical protein